MKKFLAFLIFAVFLFGCTTTGKMTASSRPPVQTPVQKIEKILNNIPVYPNLKYDTQNSFVYESAATNAAVIVLKGKAKLSDVVSFYKENMPKYGWQLLSMFVYGDKATLVYDSMESSCSIEIEQSSFDNITVTIKTGTKAAAAPVK